MTLDEQQKVADFMFSIGMMIHTEDWFKDKSREEIAAWIATKALADGLEIYTMPIGMSWGNLSSKENFEVYYKKFYNMKDET